MLQEKGNRLFAIGDTKKAEPRTGFIERLLEQICFCVLIFYVKDDALGCSIYRRWVNPQVYSPTSGDRLRPSNRLFYERNPQVV